MEQQLADATAQLAHVNAQLTTDRETSAAAEDGFLAQVAAAEAATAVAEQKLEAQLQFSQVHFR